MKVSSLPSSSCRKARLRLRLGKLRFERFPHAGAPLAPSPFVIKRRSPSQSDLDTTDLKTDNLKVDDPNVDGDHVLVVEA